MPPAVGTWCSSSSSTAPDLRAHSGPYVPLMNASLLRGSGVGAATLLEAAHSRHPVSRGLGALLVLPAASVEFAAESSSSESSSASSSSEITSAPVSRDGGHDQEVMKRACSTRATQAGQVVVLRVSLHCNGRP